jgi:ribonucleoside-triphosphate reductase
METSYSVSDRDIEKLISNGDRSNANMAHNPETIHKYVSDKVMKQHALHSLPAELRDAHVNGDLHFHDLEFMMDRSLNCLVHDLRIFLKMGLKVDGSGDHTSIAGPPRRLNTVMNHTGEILLAAQQDMSGGQGMTLWNVFVAPYINKNKEDEVYNAIQQLIFNLNMAYASRGGQVPFTTIGLELSVPDFLLDTPAVGPGGEIVGTYGDYVDEAELITKIFTELLLEGDYLGKPHLFPNTTYSLRPEYKTGYDDLKFLIHQLSAKYGTSYFVNMYPKYQGVHTDYMGCRTRLSSDWTGDWEQDTIRTGNLAYATLNLPRIALETKDDAGFLEVLRDKMELAQQYLLIRKIRGQKLFYDEKLFPFISQDINGTPYYNMENSTLSFGFCGLAEAVKLITDEDLGSTTANAVALEILETMKSIVDDYRTDGQRWSLIQTPAESTAYRFAQLDMQLYPHTIYEGTPNAPYYTNSCHLPVDTHHELVEKIKWEEKTHPLTNGGHIFHAFMGESYSDPESLMSLTDKITSTDIGFWAYSSALSFCMKCNKVLRGLQKKCPHCGETDDIEWYDRITGYVQQVGHAKHSHGGWNAGKKQELIDRRRW